MMDKSMIQWKRENVYFFISLLLSIFIYAAAIVSIIGIAIAITIFIILLFTNAIMLGSIRGNGVRIHERQFPDVYERVQVLAKEMELKKVPDVFVIQSEGALNAFATVSSAVTWSFCIPRCLKWHVNKGRKNWTSSLPMNWPM